MIEDSLFADDSTVIGWTEELKEGKEVIKKSMVNFEERCHDGKEEFVTFRTKEADKTRILGTLLGKKKRRQGCKDQERVHRMVTAGFGNSN